MRRLLKQRRTIPPTFKDAAAALTRLLDQGPIANPVPLG